MLGAVAAFVVGGILNRWRGGWLAFPASHNARRAGLTLGLAIVVFATTRSPSAAAAALLLFPGLLPPWGEWFDMGRMGEDDDFWGMAGRGLFLTAPMGVAFDLLGYGPWIIVSGVLMGPIYWLAWWAHDLIGLRRNSFIDGPTSAAEIVFMGWVFLAVVLSV